MDGRWIREQKNEFISFHHLSVPHVNLLADVLKDIDSAGKRGELQVPLGHAPKSLSGFSP